jgi:hypothetical protein
MVSEFLCSATNFILREVSWSNVAICWLKLLSHFLVESSMQSQSFAMKVQKEAFDHHTCVVLDNKFFSVIIGTKLQN